MFGLVWGTVAIVVLVAFGVGFRKQTIANMHGMGESIAIVWPGKTTKPWQGFGIGRSMYFLEEDAALVRSQVRGLKAISAEYGRRVNVRVEENILHPLVSGIYPNFGDMRNIIPERGGRFLNDPDMEQRRRVAVIGDKVKEYLFGESNAVGRFLFIGDTPFLVIGVMQKKTQPSSYNARDQDRVFIPASTYSAMFGTVYLNNIIYQVDDPLRAEEVQQEVREALSKKYKFDPSDKDAVWIWDTNNMDRFFFYLFLGFNGFLALIGSFTLAVAGIGLANIMFIVVQERTKEIGIKRSVGATKYNILSQFFLETFFILSLGASAGFLLAAGIVGGMQYVPIQEYVGTPEISAEVVAVTALVLSVIGLVAGLMPARRAANLNVVDCLRT
jgi:putative ABC transport system permease protein